MACGQIRELFDSKTTVLTIADTEGFGRNASEETLPASRQMVGVGRVLTTQGVAAIGK
jgi:hypothetical protein